MSLTTDEPTREPDPAPLDLDSLEAQLNLRQTRRDGWTLMIWAFAAVALFASAVSVGFGMRAIDEAKSSAAAGALAAGAGGTQVTLTEFSISPEMITASQAGGVDVVNNGTVEHNFAVQGTDVKTAMIPAEVALTSTSPTLPRAPTRSCARSPATRPRGCKRCCTWVPGARRAPPRRATPPQPRRRCRPNRWTPT